MVFTISLILIFCYFRTFFLQMADQIYLVIKKCQWLSQSATALFSLKLAYCSCRHQHVLWLKIPQTAIRYVDGPDDVDECHRCAQDSRFRFPLLISNKYPAKHQRTCVHVCTGCIGNFLWRLFQPL